MSVVLELVLAIASIALASGVRYDLVQHHMVEYY